jgi:hypothetical protein
MDNNNSEKHRYWSNAIGFTAFIFLLVFITKGCDDIQMKRIELEKVKATLNDSIRK